MNDWEDRLKPAYGPNAPWVNPARGRPPPDAWPKTLPVTGTVFETLDVQAIECKRYDWRGCEVRMAPDVLERFRRELYDVRDGFSRPAEPFYFFGALCYQDNAVPAGHVILMPPDPWR